MIKTPILAAAAMAFAGAAFADEMEYMPPVTHAATLEECSACHMAYPAGFLPPQSWKVMMATLDNHFGENAGLDEEMRVEIEKYLVANAGRDRSGDGAAPQRISDLPWFRHEHEEEVSKRQFEKAKSWANCTACHKKAEKGVFEDD
ncbi:diheme cytochrome c [Aliiruegeria sabulilitoris]|uniref:diheme cytochrome c n=1 Tax=Aliiruegeria sabulilitoris TaxID=1510458 RepID=UPI000830F429|nr:diheme cytochrome c [Aliiruegeria sabulilitoris]NDR58847.1 cytochrome C [Pseudoruegeria sp. M32A2M]